MISQSGVPIVSSFLRDRNKTALFLKPITEEEVRKTILSCKGKPSLDVDDISMLIIQKTMNYTIKPLVHMFNLCFERDGFPDEMKISKVLPIFKKGKRNYLSNYRLISLLPQISKILEKLFAKRLNCFLASYRIINNCQYDFKAKTSTRHILADATHYIISNLDYR